ncbi:MAG: imidazole glycerol phosphate synthase subunit HisH [Prevotella sp.]|nr:imidazole glycerol phosphate synthase subunit HisH [Prevotellaceae bacterium]MDY4891147.1 imidazole glycerol phosphate synthase subunit HisH [Prevotella sp.]MDY5250042.1 imidazole glycerol phosphate synthase subunit HisH [Prevotella sp.]
MKVAIVKYNAGNVFSVENALRRLGIQPLLTDNEHQLMTADKVIFPGQGEASGAMAYLIDHHLDRVIRNLTQPVLGICIGQQLLCKHSEEGNTDCLGIFDANVVKFRPTCHEQKVPAIGWNAIHDTKGELYKGFDKTEYVYFVHSYHVPLCKHTTAVADYITPFSASLQKDNFFATQFHPEKSGSVGERILRNFLEI